MEEIFKILGNYGVPTAIAFWLLVKLQPAVETLIKTVNDLINKVSNLDDKIEDLCRNVKKRKKL